MTHPATTTDQTLFSIQLPPKADDAEQVSFTLRPGNSVLFIGANGAGKTRMAGWLDKQLLEKGFYIPANRSVQMPASYKLESEKRQFQHIYSNTTWTNDSDVDVNTMKIHRYNKPVGAFSSSDFQSVLNILAARHASSMSSFGTTYDPAAPPTKKPQSLLMQAIKIWSSCLPYLNIRLDAAPDFVVERLDRPGEQYQPFDMSDGERSVFYVVAKSLLAPDNTVIIIDEPELHIHRSVRNQLWDSIEQAKQTCAFAYFTHDIDFATSRVFTKRIAINSFRSRNVKDRTAGVWDYDFLRDDEDLPQETLLKVIGSRRNMLMVEGNRGSLDIAITRALYPQFLIEPVQTCGQVISQVAALNHANKYHNRDVFGLIDRDFRADSQIEHFATRRIYAHRFRDIENVLVSEAAIEAICANLGRCDAAAEICAKFADVIAKRVLSDRDSYVRRLSVAQARVEFDQVFGNSDANSSSLEQLTQKVDQRTIVTNATQRVSDALASGKLDPLLGIVSVRKDDLRDVIARLLPIGQWDDLEQSCLGWLKAPESENGRRLLKALAIHMPRI